MDFALVLEQITGRFNASKIPYALMGGFALQASGYSRSTRDLDFLVEYDRLEDVKKIMEALSYKRIYIVMKMCRILK